MPMISNSFLRPGFYFSPAEWSDFGVALPRDVALGLRLGAPYGQTNEG